MSKPLLLALLMLTLLPAAEAEAPGEDAVDWPARILAIAAEAPAYAPAGYDPSVEALWAREVLQAYDGAGYTEDWAADCRALLVAGGRSFAQHPEAFDAQRLVAMALELRARGCRDSMMHYLHGLALDWTGDASGAIAVMGHDLLSVAEAPYSAKRKFLFAFRLMQIGHDAGQFHQRWVDDATRFLIESYREGDWVGSELGLAQLLGSSFSGRPFSGMVRAAHVQICEGLLPELRDDDWCTPAYLVGYHIQAAWNARGTGWSSSVTEEGWRGFQHHLQQAYEAGLAGLEDERIRGHCATKLLSVCLGHEEARARSLEWFAAALEADFNQPEPYDAMEQLLLARWHGGPEAQLDMANLLWSTMRFDTLAMVEGVQQIERLLQDLPAEEAALRQQLLGMEELSRPVGVALNGILDCENMSGFHPWANAWLCAIHYAAGRMADAHACAQAAGAAECQRNVQPPAAAGVEDGGGPARGRSRGCGAGRTGGHPLIGSGSWRGGTQWHSRASTGSPSGPNSAKPSTGPSNCRPSAS